MAKRVAEQSGMPEEVVAVLNEHLDEESVALFTEAEIEELPDIVEELGDDLPDEVTEAVLGYLEDALAGDDGAEEPEEEPEPEPEPAKPKAKAKTKTTKAKTTKAKVPASDGSAKDERAARREALLAKAQQKGTKKEGKSGEKKTRVDRAKKLQEEKNAVIVEELSQLFAGLASQPGAVLVMQSLGKRKIAIYRDDNVSLKGGRRRSAARAVANKLKSPEYLEWQKDMRANYPDVETRTAYAESLGLTGGTWEQFAAGEADFPNTNKAGDPLASGPALMKLNVAIRGKLGIEKYKDGITPSEYVKMQENGSTEAAPEAETEAA